MTRDEYDDTVEALNDGAELPDVRKPEPSRPTPEVVIGFAMIGMIALVNAGIAWPDTIGEYAGLIGFVYFVALVAWARGGRRR